MPTTADEWEQFTGVRPTSIHVRATSIYEESSAAAYMRGMKAWMSYMREHIPAVPLLFTCARCNATLDVSVVQPCLDEIMAAHHDRCFVVGDYVRWERDGDSWIEGEVLWLGDRMGYPFARVRVDRGSFGDDGTDQSLGVKYLRRIERPGPTLYDGLTAEQCLQIYTMNQRNEGIHVVLTPAQLTAARDLWSQQLYARIATARARGRLTMCIEQDAEDTPW